MTHLTLPNGHCLLTCPPHPQSRRRVDLNGNSLVPVSVVYCRLRSQRCRADFINRHGGGLNLNSERRLAVQECPSSRSYLPIPAVCAPGALNSQKPSRVDAIGRRAYEVTAV